MSFWKVGELARETGITVRTLHHYDEMGLVCPSKRTASGYRLYGEADLVRLQQVLSLRQLGFSLDEIRSSLDEERWTTSEVLEMHLARMEARIAEHVRLRDRVRRLLSSLRDSEEVSIEEFIHTMRMITMLEKYYTPEQLQALDERRQTLGEDRIGEVEAEWPRLMAEVQAELDQGTDPADERMQALATRWMGLVREFTGGDPGIERSVQNLYQNEDEVAGMDVGPVRALQAYVARAIAAGKNA
jgi:MerR family transcriptional regulator, thiopeptide resistance regulator